MSKPSNDNAIDFTKTYEMLDRKLTEERYRTLYTRMREDFARTNNIAHNWEHVRRVIVNAVYIALQEQAEMDIVLPAIILHDLGYATNPDEPKKHPQNGAARCYDYLDAWEPGERDLISDCILKHKGKYPGYGVEPESLEEKVVCDGDQVDKFGWVGFMQMLKVYVEYGVRGHTQYSTLAGLAEAITHQQAMVLYTETGKDFARRMEGPDTMSVSEILTAQLAPYEDWQEGI
jgi:HD superfamily phosphodiesterase